MYIRETCAIIPGKRTGKVCVTLRRLWIHRRKSPAAGMKKMKVYMEDPQGDALINGFLCRKLGELKNGQMRSFTISNQALRVFVVADSFTRDMNNAFAVIPEGEEDAVLSGRNVRTSFGKHSFCFDTGAVLRPEKQGNRLLMVLAAVAAMLVGTAAGLGAAIAASGISLADNPETFAAEELRITLPDDFQEADVSGYTACFASGETAVFILREEPDREVFGDLSLDVYGAMILANSGFGQDVQIDNGQGLTTFRASRTNGETGQEYFYYCGLFRSADAYWLVQITTAAENPEEQIPLFRQWLTSVKFEE